MTNPSSYAQFKAGGIVFCMDNSHLLIKINGERPRPLSTQDTHRPLNMLYIHRQAIIDGNTAAKQFGGSYFPSQSKAAKSKQEGV